MATIPETESQPQELRSLFTSSLADILPGLNISLVGKDILTFCSKQARERRILISFQLNLYTFRRGDAYDCLKGASAGGFEV